MLCCNAAIVTRCDGRADFGACPCCDYSAVGEPFVACPCRDYSAAAWEPFRRQPLLCIQKESSRLLYKLIAIFVAAHVLLGYSTVVADVLQPIEKHGGICECLSSRGALLDASQSRTKLSGM